MTFTLSIVCFSCGKQHSFNRIGHWYGCVLCSSTYCEKCSFDYMEDEKRKAKIVRRCHCGGELKVII